jgi:hypothetical protein
VEQQFPSPTSLKTFAENVEEKNVYSSSGSARQRNLEQRNVQGLPSISGSIPAEIV